MFYFHRNQLLTVISYCSATWTWSRTESTGSSFLELGLSGDEGCHSSSSDEAVRRWLMPSGCRSPCWLTWAGQRISPSQTRGAADHTWSWVWGWGSVCHSSSLCFCLLNIRIKPSVDESGDICQTQGAAGTLRSLPAHQLLGIFREGLAVIHVSPLSLLAARLNTLRCIVRRPGRSIAMWVSRKRWVGDPTNRGPQRLWLPLRWSSKFSSSESTSPTNWHPEFIWDVSHTQLSVWRTFSSSLLTFTSRFYWSKLIKVINSYHWMANINAICFYFYDKLKDF